MMNHAIFSLANRAAGAWRQANIRPSCSTFRRRKNIDSLCWSSANNGGGRAFLRSDLVEPLLRRENRYTFSAPNSAHVPAADRLSGRLPACLQLFTWRSGWKVKSNLLS